MTALHEQIREGQVPPRGGYVLDLSERLRRESDGCVFSGMSGYSTDTSGTAYISTRWRYWSHSPVSPCLFRASASFSARSKLSESLCAPNSSRRTMKSAFLAFLCLSDFPIAARNSSEQSGRNEEIKRTIFETRSCARSVARGCPAVVRGRLQAQRRLLPLYDRSSRSRMLAKSTNPFRRSRVKARRRRQIRTIS